MSNPSNSPLSPPPGHQDQGARLAASAQVDQVGGTPTLEQFQRWLEDRAHDAAHATWPSPLPNEKPILKHQKGGALLLLLVAIGLFCFALKYLDNSYPCGIDPVDRMNCKQEQGK